MDNVTVKGQTVGGMAGEISGFDETNNCMSLATVITTGSTWGGFVGHNYAPIYNCYTNEDAFVGSHSSYYGYEIKNCYYVSDTEVDDEDGTTALKVEQMTAATGSTKSTAEGWVNIEVRNSSGTTIKSGCMALVDELNEGVQQINSEFNPLNWLNGLVGYPVLGYEGTVRFMGNNNTVLDLKEYNTTGLSPETIEIPGIPYFYGYQAKGWTLEGDDNIYTNTDLGGAIIAKFVSGTEVVTVEAKYTELNLTDGKAEDEINDEYTLKVT